MSEEKGIEGVTVSIQENGRKVFYVDVGDMSMERAVEYIRDLTGNKDLILQKFNILDGWTG